MNLKQRIEAFVHLGKIMKSLADEEFQSAVGLTQEEFDAYQELIQRAKHYNAWFVEENVRAQMRSLASMLDKETLSAWVSDYTLQSKSAKKVAIIMAGNIPMVGFHDLMCVLMSGHHALVKYSSEDDRLIPALLKLWGLAWPDMAKRISQAEGKMTGFDAVIATGSNNSARYFEQYFGDYPHIIRKNRTSIAVLTGDETKEDLLALGKDVFNYFGLGCRNVTKLFLPKNFEIQTIFEAWFSFQEIINHNKYANNYDYHKALWLMNQEQILDNGFLMLREEEDQLVSPVGSLYYQRYDNQEAMKKVLVDRADELQCIVGEGGIPFGKAQFPRIDDYADGVDTMSFLSKL